MSIHGRFPRLVAVLAAAALAGGCALLGLGRTRQPVQLYTLTAERDSRTDLPRVDWQLLVEEPLAVGGLDSTRIAVRHSPLEIEYYAGARWAVRAPKMVQTLLIESLEASGQILAVTRQAVGLRSDYTVRLELRRFEAEDFEAVGRPNVRVEVTAKLLRQQRQRIIAGQSFEWVVPSKSRSMRDIVAAYDEALRHVLRRVVEWTLVTPAEVAAAEAAASSSLP